MIEPDFHDSLELLKSSFEGGNEASICVEAVRRRFEPSRIALLDVGVGSGQSTIEVLEALGSSGFKLDAVFVGPNVPENRGDVLRSHGELIEERFEDTDLKGRFDVVKATHSIYYLGNQALAARRLLSAVSNGGMLLITSWSEECVLYKLYDQVFRGRRPTYTIESLQVFFKESIGVTTEVVYSTGTVSLGMWKRDDSICGACARVISRANDSATIESCEPFQEALRKLSDNEIRVNGTLIVIGTDRKLHHL